MTCLCLQRSLVSKPSLYGDHLFYLRRLNAPSLRHYAAKRPPLRFDARDGPNPEEIFRDLKQKYPSSPGPKKIVGPGAPRGLRKYGITPGRLLLISIISYLGYRFYNWKAQWAHRSLVMNGRWFTPFLLESKDQVSSTSSIFNLRSVPAGQNASNIEEAWKLGVWSVQVLQPDMQIARSYTPLPPNDETSHEQLRLVVRKEPEGMVSGYLHKQPPASTVQLRGPHPEYVIPDDVEEVVFIAGGTGIAPALQVAHCLQTVREIPAEKKPKIHILWANRRREDSFAGFKPTSTESFRTSILAKIRAGLDLDKIGSSTEHSVGSTGSEMQQMSEEQSPLIKEVEALRRKHGDRINIEYFVDEDNTFITEGVLREHLTANQATSGQESPSAGKKLVIISGPDGFVSAYAGPKGMLKGRETQGPIGGLLERIDHGAWDVWKL